MIDFTNSNRIINRFIRRRKWFLFNTHQFAGTVSGSDQLSASFESIGSGIAVGPSY